MNHANATFKRRFYYSSYTQKEWSKSPLIRISFSSSAKKKNILLMKIVFVFLYADHQQVNSRDMKHFHCHIDTSA